MNRSAIIKPKTSSYKDPHSSSAEKVASSIRFGNSPIKHDSVKEQRKQLQSAYDVRFKRKDFNQFPPRYFVTADITEQDVIELKQVFDYYDSTKIGVLLPNDLKVLLNQNGFLPSKKTIYEIIAQFDLQQTGGISFFEFMKAMNSKPYEKQRKKDIQHVFKKYDRANKGYINLQDLKEMTKQLQEDVDEEMMKLMIERASRTQGDKIYFQEFYAVMKKPVY